MSQGGNIEAIRDWANKFFYKKDDVDGFFLKADDTNLKAYKLTILGTPGLGVTITENAATNPQSYAITLGSDGVYAGLFFFHSGSTLTLNGQTHQLVTYTDVIVLSGAPYSSVTLDKVLDVAQKSYSGSTTFTAADSALYLMLNIDINNENSNYNLLSRISGTPICTRTITEPNDSPKRNLSIAAAVHLLNQNDQILLENDYSNGNYVLQLHLAFKLLTGYIPALTHFDHLFKADGNLGTTQIVNLPAGKYLAVGITEGCSGSTSAFSTAITSNATINSNITFKDTLSGGTISGTVAIIEAAEASTVTFTLNSPVSYCSRGYIIYRLDA